MHPPITEWTTTEKMDKEELVELERGFWRAETDYYRAHVTDTVVFVFPGMVLDKKEGTEGIEEQSGWSQLDITDTQLIELNTEVALLTYHATASREGNEGYSAQITSVYKMENGRPHLAFHQHTPDPEK